VLAVDDLKSLMRRFVDEFQSNGDEAVADELLADIFRNHTAPPGMSPDKPGVTAYFAAFRRAVPDLHAQVHDMLADGDKVVTRKTLHGTHTGGFMGLPPTGNAISVDVIDTVRVGGFYRASQHFLDRGGRVVFSASRPQSASGGGS
jgi:predicted ester cyclase